MNYSITTFCDEGISSIKAAQFIDKRFSQEMLLISADGGLYRSSLKDNKALKIAQLAGLLQVEEPIKIYTYKQYAAIVNNRGTKGVVVNLADNSLCLSLHRGDYQVEHCSFPISFYTYQNSVYLIHGTDWNRLDITCLSDGKVVTERIVKYDREQPINYLDYFHSLLCVSPDELSFISNGWVWQPFDVMLLWRVDDFLQTYEVKNHSLSVLETSGYNWDRPLCWIDNQSVGYGYNEQEGTTVDINQDLDSHIVIQDVTTNEIIAKVPFNGLNLNRYGEVSGTLEYDRLLHAFIGFNDNMGVTIVDRQGTLLFRNQELKPISYSSDWNAFLSITDNQVNIVRLYQ